MTERILPLDENDSLAGSQAARNSANLTAQTYDFQRPDRIAKEQLRAIHVLHDNFGRSLASSLSAYLREYVAVNLVSVEQLGFFEFTQILPTPTTIVALGLEPYDGSAVLEVGPTLVFPMLEMLLGGKGQLTNKVDREITEIEWSIFDAVLRIVLNDLRAAWRSVADIAFSVQSWETEGQLLRVLAPTEALVAITLEVRIGEVTGIINLGIPSITVKMLRQKFDQQWNLRKTQTSEEEQSRMLRLIQPAKVELEACLQGPTLRTSNLLELKHGDVLVFDYPVDRRIDLMVNGSTKYRGEIVAVGSNRAFQTTEIAVDD